MTIIYKETVMKMKYGPFFKKKVRVPLPVSGNEDYTKITKKMTSLLTTITMLRIYHLTLFFVYLFFRAKITCSTKCSSLIALKSTSTAVPRSPSSKVRSSRKARTARLRFSQFSVCCQ